MGIIIALIIVVIISFLLYGRFTYCEWRTETTKIPPFKDCKLNDGDFLVCRLFVTIMVTLVISFIIGLIGIGKTETAIKENKVETIVNEVSTSNIYALQDNLFLSRKNYNGTFYYYTLENVNGKGKHTEKYSASNSYINYISKGEQPYVKQVKRKIKNKSLYMFYFPTPVTEYYFYIPEGSIVEEYNVDLQ